jgi:hypothetical protein
VNKNYELWDNPHIQINFLSYKIPENKAAAIGTQRDLHGQGGNGDKQRIWGIRGEDNGPRSKEI